MAAASSAPRSPNRNSIASISSVFSTTSTGSNDRRASTISDGNTLRSHHLKANVQLVPHSPSPALLSTPLSPAENELLQTMTAKFDELDLSSQDFDFEDVFTFDKPQRKLPKVVEITSSVPKREVQQRPHHHHPHHNQRDWGRWTFSHYGHSARIQTNRDATGIGAAQMYVRNQINAHRN